MEELHQNCQAERGTNCSNYLVNSGVNMQGERALVFAGLTIGIPVFLFLLFFAVQFVMTGKMQRPEASGVER